MDAYKKTFKQSADYSSELFAKNVANAVFTSDTADFYFENGMKTTIDVPETS